MEVTSINGNTVTTANYAFVVDNIGKIQASGSGSQVEYRSPQSVPSQYIVSQTPAEIAALASSETPTEIIDSITASITAFAGGGQGSATALTSTINNVTTVATAGDSVLLPEAQAGLVVIVQNNGANAADVFPFTGETINGGSANAAVSLPVGGRMEFIGTTGTNWTTDRAVVLLTNIVAAKEVNHTFTVSTTTTAATVGGNLTIAAGAGATTGAGGDLPLAAGAGGNDAVGGVASLTGGAAGGGNRAGGIGKTVGGAGAGSAAGGAVEVTGGVAGDTGTGGAVNITSGAGGSSSGPSGALTIKSANETSTDASGALAISTGTTATANSGGITVGSGAVTTGNSGGLTLSTGNAGTGASGDITLSPGTASTVVGKVITSNALIQKHKTAAINSTATATAKEVATGYITSTSAAGTTITLPTGTLLGGELGAAQGTIHELYIDNTAGANTVTIAVAVNGILSDAATTTAASFGQLTVASGVTGLGRFTLIFSSGTAYTLTRTA